MAAPLSILISGAGITGPTLACFLAKSGHNVVIVEKAQSLRDGGYIIDFWGEGYNIVSQMGLEGKVKEAGYSVEKLTLVDGKGEQVGGFPLGAIAELVDGKVTSLPRGDLAKIIFEHMKEEYKDKISVKFGESIAKLEQVEGEEGRGVNVIFESGEEARFDLVVGADGLHSNVRALAFPEVTRAEHYLGFKVAAIKVDNYPKQSNEYIMYTQVGKSISRFSMRDNQSLILFVYIEDEKEEGKGVSTPHTLEERKKELKEVFQDGEWETEEILKAVDQADEIYIDGVSQVKMMQHGWSKANNVVLVGDAAACPSLLAGEGSGLGIIAAYILAGEIHSHPGDLSSALSSYHSIVYPFVTKKQEDAVYLSSFFAPRSSFSLWMRNLVTWPMKSPTIAKFLIGRSIIDDIVIKDYFGEKEMINKL